MSYDNFLRMGRQQLLFLIADLLDTVLLSEWLIVDDSMGKAVCIHCFAAQEHGEHRPDCKLDAVLMRAGLTSQALRDAARKRIPQ